MKWARGGAVGEGEVLLQCVGLWCAAQGTSEGWTVTVTTTHLDLRARDRHVNAKSSAWCMTGTGTLVVCTRIAWYMYDKV